MVTRTVYQTSSGKRMLFRKSIPKKQGSFTRMRHSMMDISDLHKYTVHTLDDLARVELNEEETAALDDKLERYIDEQVKVIQDEIKRCRRSL